MATSALLPIQLVRVSRLETTEARDPDRTLLNDLRALASRMIGHGHRPSSFLLVRLTDGRIKMVQCEGGAEQSGDDLRRVTNEYGPVGRAFRVWTEADDVGLVARVEEVACWRAGGVGPAPQLRGNPLLGLAGTERCGLGPVAGLLRMADLTAG